MKFDVKGFKLSVLTESVENLTVKGLKTGTLITVTVLKLDPFLIQ